MNDSLIKQIYNYSLMEPLGASKVVVIYPYNPSSSSLY